MYSAALDTMLGH